MIGRTFYYAYCPLSLAVTWKPVLTLKRVLVMKVKENFVVINGVRYDVVKDSDSFDCKECALHDKCYDSDGCFCIDMFSYENHFEVK